MQRQKERESPLFSVRNDFFFFFLVEQELFYTYFARSGDQKKFESHLLYGDLLHKETDKPNFPLMSLVVVCHLKSCSRMA